MTFCYIYSFIFTSILGYTLPSPSLIFIISYTCSERNVQVRAENLNRDGDVSGWYSYDTFLDCLAKEEGKE